MALSFKDTLATYPRLQDLRLKQGGRGCSQGVSIEHSKVRPITRCDLTEVMLSEASQSGPGRHALQGTLAIQGLLVLEPSLGIPLNILAFDRRIVGAQRGNPFDREVRAQWQPTQLRLKGLVYVCAPHSIAAESLARPIHVTRGMGRLYRGNNGVGAKCIEVILVHDLGMFNAPTQIIDPSQQIPIHGKHPAHGSISDTMCGHLKTGSLGALDLLYIVRFILQEEPLRLRTIGIRL